MLYLNSIENAEASPTERKYAICHEEVPSMQNVPELAPSRRLLTQWESKEISWEEFHGQFWTEMRTEYRKGETSQLKELASDGLENDVTLHSPEPGGEQTYRAILEEIINLILESEDRTDRVINLVRVEGPKDNAAHQDRQMFAEVIAAKNRETELLIENAELKARINLLEEKINTHTESIKLLEEKISYKDGEIRLLTDSTRKRGKLNDGLKTQIAQLQEQIKNHPESIKARDNKIQLLRDESHKKSRENDDLKKQMDQLQDINAQRRIIDIAVKATGNDQEFEEHFRTLNIGENLPVDLRKWLEALLKQALSIGSNDRTGLSSLIYEYTNFNEEYSTESGRFDKSDNYLAHVIRTQGNISVHENPDERTEMGRALCCFFAAALLSPKMPHQNNLLLNSHLKYG